MHCKPYKSTVTSTRGTLKKRSFSDLYTTVILLWKQFKDWINIKNIDSSNLTKVIAVTTLIAPQHPILITRAFGIPQNSCHPPLNVAQISFKSCHFLATTLSLCDTNTIPFCQMKETDFRPTSLCLLAINHKIFAYIFCVLGVSLFPFFHRSATSTWLRFSFFPIQWEIK